MAFVINGVKYSDIKGDSIKEAAQDLLAKGEHIHQGAFADTYASPSVIDAIEREREKLEYINGPHW